MDVNKLNQGEKIAAGSAIVLFLVMFIFDWFSIGGEQGDLAKQAGVDTGGNAWQVFSLIDLLMFLTIIVAVGLAVMAATSNSPNLPVAGSAVVTILGGLCVLFLLIRLISPPDGGFDQLDISRSIGVYLGFLLAIGITVGGWLSMQEDGVSFQGEADRFQGGNDNPPPPPPPQA